MRQAHFIPALKFDVFLALAALLNIRFAYVSLRRKGVTLVSKGNALFQQVFVDIEQAAAGKDFTELVFQQLIHAGAARHDHRLDVEVIQRVCHAVEQHAVVGADPVGLVALPRGILRVAAAQIAGRQHGDRPDFVQHRLRRQAYLAEQPFRAAAGKIKHYLTVVAQLVRVADDRHDTGVFDVEQRARSLAGQVARHRLVDEVDHPCAAWRPNQRSAADSSGRPFGLSPEQAKAPGNSMAGALRLVAQLDHHLAQQLDDGRVGGAEEQHRAGGHQVEFFLALFAQEVAHRDRHIAEVDIHRAGTLALVAYCAVVGDIAEFGKMLDGHAAPRLLLVQECLDQQRGREYLVARRIQQVGARHMGVAHRLAFAATQAVLDRIGDLDQLALLEDQALQFHQVEAGRVGALEVAATEQLALVEAALGIDLLLVFGERRDFAFFEEVELGDADAVLAGDHAAQVLRQLHDAVDRAVGLLQHRVVVGVHRDVGVHVAVARVHVQRDEHPALQHVLVHGVALVEYRLVSAAAEHLAQRLAQLALPRGADAVVLQGLENTNPPRSPLVRGEAGLLP